MVAEGMFATGAVGSYCTSEDVLALIEAYELDENTESLRERIRGLLNNTRHAIDIAAGRDFLHHENETKTLDGTGSATLTLGQAGIHPPVEVEQVAVDGSVIEASQWRYYASANSIRLTQGSRLQRFPEGVQNVQVTLTWGFQQPPGDIVSAQAKLTAAEMLSGLGGDSQAVKSLRLGDYAVSYSEGGRYGADIARLVSEAKEAARRYRSVGMVTV